ncbi:hypothetical protein ABBQ32_011304 [Trebouxia sp. C0010 RCD-2024]
MLRQRAADLEGQNELLCMPVVITASTRASASSLRNTASGQSRVKDVHLRPLTDMQMQAVIQSLAKRSQHCPEVPSSLPPQLLLLLQLVGGNPRMLCQTLCLLAGSTVVHNEEFPAGRAHCWRWLQGDFNLVQVVEGLCNTTLKDTWDSWVGADPIKVNLLNQLVAHCVCRMPISWQQLVPGSQAAGAPTTWQDMENDGPAYIGEPGECGDSGEQCFAKGIVPDASCALACLEAGHSLSPLLCCKSAVHLPESCRALRPLSAAVKAKGVPVLTGTFGRYCRHQDQTVLPHRQGKLSGCCCFWHIRHVASACLYCVTRTDRSPYSSKIKFPSDQAFKVICPIAESCCVAGSRPFLSMAKGIIALQKLRAQAATLKKLVSPCMTSLGQADLQRQMLQHKSTLSWQHSCQNAELLLMLHTVHCQSKTLRRWLNTDSKIFHLHKMGRPLCRGCSPKARGTVPGPNTALQLMVTWVSATGGSPSSCL